MTVLRFALWGVLGLIVVGALGFGGWLMTLPTPSPAVAAEPIPQDEMDAALAALSGFGEAAEGLRNLARFVVERRN